MIEKIKAEIERLKDWTDANFTSIDFYDGAMGALLSLTSFIESLEQEQPKKINVTGDDFSWIDELKHDLEHPEELDKRVAKALGKEKSEIPTIPQGLDEAAEEEAKKWGNEYFQYRGWLSYCFKAGAKWMAEQFQKIEGELVDWYETKGVDYCCGIKTEDAFEVPKGFYIRKK